jgi:glycyl-tRNA synthetase beta chain
VELLFEIGTEELPPAAVVPAVEFLAREFAAQSKAQRLSHGSIATFATPRRLALLVSDVAASSADLAETKLGPPARISFDADGSPTKAAAGFARGLGIAVEDLVRVETDKGEYIAAHVTAPGKPSADVLAPLLDAMIRGIPWPKPMRWGWGEETWARPVHWILAMLDDSALPVSFAGIESGLTSRGHRFMSPGPLTIETPGAYEASLEAAHVVADVAKRRASIWKMACEAVSPNRPVTDDGLLNEVTQLVEYPIAAVGTFDERYLELPRELLISEMREHQRYFAVENLDGELRNQFIVINNTKVEDPAVVLRGNQRVLVARLSDGEFFLNRDRQRPLASRVDDLRTVVYLEQLGSVRERIDRLVVMAGKLSSWLSPEVSEWAQRAALLSKADLTTAVVNEFPKLQGLMGATYARHDGEPEEVATAIFEHYLPRSASDGVAQSKTGIVVAIAEKIDAIAGCFGVGLQPTGTADPYGLRRAALGIIRTTIEHDLVFSLRTATCEALAGLPVDVDGSVAAQIETFFARRLKAMLSGEVRADVIDAVVATGLDDISAVVQKIHALAAMRDAADFEPLAIAFKRVANILKKTPTAAVDPGLFEEEAESRLWEVYGDIRARVESALRKRDFEAGLGTLIELKGPVDRFFDDVLVMAEDEALKDNRLALLRDLRTLFETFADISRIQVEAR